MWGTTRPHLGAKLPGDRGTSPFDFTAAAVEEWAPRMELLRFPHVEFFGSAAELLQRLARGATARVSGRARRGERLQRQTASAAMPQLVEESAAQAQGLDLNGSD